LTGRIALSFGAVRDSSIPDSVTTQVGDAKNVEPLARPAQTSSSPDAIQEITNVIAGIISWLHRISNTIRVASAGSRNVKAAAFPIKEDEISALKQMYSYWIKRDFPGATSELCDRLVLSMIARRRRVLYRRSRQERLRLQQHVPVRKHISQPILQISDNTDSVQPQSSEPPPLTIPSVTASVSLSEFTATTIRPEQYRRVTAPSRVSEALTISLSKQDEPVVPPPPRIVGQTEFICPYCCLIRPLHEATNKRTWA
jgi:hypothetical protein